LSPVLFGVATAAAEIDCLAVYRQPALDAVIQADHAVVALHERHPGVPAHDARRAQRHGPGPDRAKTQLAAHRQLWCVDLHRQAIGGEVVRADVQVKDTFGGPELTGRVTVVSGLTGPAVQHLHKCVVLGRVVAQKDAGDDRVAVLFAGVDGLVIPALEEGRFLAMPVIAGRVQCRPHKSAHLVQSRFWPILTVV